jgi:hypothetical protein
MDGGLEAKINEGGKLTLGTPPPLSVGISRPVCDFPHRSPEHLVLSVKASSDVVCTGICPLTTIMSSLFFAAISKTRYVLNCASRMKIKSRGLLT